jgi:acyl-CoA synthetase (AMP-forming)/AMP-acid ligase II
MTINDFKLIEAGQVSTAKDFLGPQVSDDFSSAGFIGFSENRIVIDVSKAGVAGVIRVAMGGGWLVRDFNGEVIPDVKHGKNPHVGLQTSGTTGRPKWVITTLDRLTSKIKGGKEPARWLLTYNPGSFAGLQVILSAFLGGHTLVVPPYEADVTTMVDLSVAEAVTHISGTPTFWRAFLMALGNRPLDLKSATLGGEASDQAILDAVATRFPNAAIRHIYATTEVGRVFSVGDGRAGFPLKVLKGRLAISKQSTLIVGGIDTGDVVEVVGNRVLFRGRLDAMVNVGGVKVYPETVEAHMLQLSFIQDVRVSPRPNPITGHVLVADIMLKPDSGFEEAQIKAHLQSLPRAQRPVSLRYVEALDIGATGKKSRSL